MKLKIVYLFILLLTLPATADESFARLFPENTAFFFEFDNNPPANSNFHKTSFSNILNEQQTQQFLAHSKKKLAEIMNLAAIMTNGIKVDDLLSGFGNHVAIGIFTKDSITVTQVIVEFPESVNPIALLANINPDGPNATEFNLTYPIKLEDPKQFVSIKISGNMLYLVISQDQNYLDNGIKQQPSSLATSTDFLRANSKIGKDRLLTIFINPFMYDVIQTLNHELQLKVDLSQISPELFNTAAFGICIQEPAFVQRTYFKHPTLNMPYNALSEPDLDQLALVTYDATSAITTGIDLKQTFELLLKGTLMNQQETKGLSSQQQEELYNEIITTLNEETERLKKDYGVDPINDIINNLGTKITYYNQTTDRLPGLELFGFGASTCIVNVRNKADLANALEKSTDALIDIFKDQAAQKLEFHTDFGIIKGISLANTFTLCYLFIDDVIIFSLNPSAIDYALIQNNAGNTLLTSPAFIELQKLIKETAEKSGISGNPVVISFMKVDGISDLLNNTVALGGALSAIKYSSAESEKIRKTANGVLPFSPIPDPSVNPPAFLKYLGEMFPLYLLPSKQVINENIFDTWSASFITEENELIDLTYGPFPIDSTIFTKDFGNIIRAAAFAAIALSAEDNF